MRAKGLKQWIAARCRGAASVVVALSGGVDSGLVAALAADALGGRVTAVTGDHALTARREVERAEAIAAHLRLRRRTLRLGVLEDPLVRANGPERCLGCKRLLFRAIREAFGADCVMLDGDNADDDSARPGLRAAREFGVLAPLRACGVGKREVRELARAAGLPNWARPSESCLATRIAPGVPLDAERLGRVEAMESFFHGLGAETVRVRLDNLVATVEYAPHYTEIVGKNRDNFAAEIKRIGVCSCRFREWRG